MIKDAHCSLQGNECNNCIVYRFGSLCIEDIKELLYNRPSDCDPRTAIIEFLNRTLDNDSITRFTKND